ncbi:MAG: hypothetical protein Q8O90_02315 [Elusimicrobiota bacterium]|nr:hypothetical protein [Elusimicrobiota bacterium]
METFFSNTLVELRKEAGFPTAYSFFHDNGGVPVLKVSYRNYLMMEKGGILPVFGRLKALIFGLRVAPNGPAAGALVVAWLKTTTGEEDFNGLLKPLLTARTTALTMPPMHKAMEKSLAGDKYHITPAQLAVIAGSRANFRCFMAMTNDSGVWTAKALAPLMGLKADAALNSLKALVSVKLLKKVKGAFNCPFTDSFFQFPHMSGPYAEMHARIEKYKEEMLATGKTMWFRRGFLRADADALSGFFPILNVSVSSAHSYSVTKKSDSSALFAIDARVVKLLDF